MTNITKQYPICPNCGQWQRPRDGIGSFYDCMNDCTARGLAPKVVAANQSTAPTQDDQWEPLRSKLTLREAQYLNTYAKTGDSATLSALVLGIIARRDELLAACKALQENFRDRKEPDFITLRQLSAAIARAEGRAQ